MSGHKEGRRKLTEVTWENTPVVDRQRRHLHWPALADLAEEYAQLTGLPKKDARVLVDFAASGHPLLLTWDTWLEGLVRWERQAVVVIVERIYHLPGQDNPFRVRVRYPGFGHEVTSGQIVAASMVEPVISYSTERPPPPVSEDE